MNFFKEIKIYVNPLSANPTEWLNTVKQLVGCCRQTCLSVFDHLVVLALKRLIKLILYTCAQKNNRGKCFI